MLEVSKFTNEQLREKRKLEFQKVRTKVLLEQYGIEGIELPELKNLQTWGIIDNKTFYREVRRRNGLAVTENNTAVQSAGTIKSATNSTGIVSGISS